MQSGFSAKVQSLVLYQGSWRPDLPEIHVHELHERIRVVITINHLRL